MSFSSDPYSISRESGRLPAKDWFEERRGQLEGAFASPSRYDEQRAEFVLREQPEIDIVQAHTDRFNQALEIYRTTTKNKSLDDLDVSKSHTWDEVMRQYELAQLKYDGKSKGVRGLARKIGRFMGNNASFTKPMISLIPQNEYTSALCCGLFLIFGAAGRMSDKRKLIFESFGEVPSTIQEAEDCCQDFSADEVLRAEAIELYVAVLFTIMEMMKWLVEKAGLKQIKALMQGDQYARSLDDKIKDVQKHLKALQDRVEKLTRRTILNIDSNTQKQALQVDHLGVQAREIKEDTNASRVSLQHMESDVQLIKEGFEAEKDEKGLLKKGIEAQNSMMNVLVDTHQRAEWNEKNWKLERRKKEGAERQVQALRAELEQARSQKSAGILLAPAQLLEILAVDLNQPASEVALMLRQGAAVDPSHQSRGHLLMRSAQFQAWQTSGSSECLLVDGNDHRASGRTSAMTVVSALLAQSLTNQPATAIQFFCGLHTNPDDTMSGPRGLLRSLIAQLVVSQGCSVRFVDIVEYNELLRYEIRRLCHVLEDVVRQLPVDFVLFCIIDGISLFESFEWNEETCLAVQIISGLTFSSKVHAIFKVLLTSPFVSRYAAKYVPRDAHLRLPYDPALGAGHTMTARSMMMQSRRSMEPNPGFEESSSRDLFAPDIGQNDEGFVDGNFDESDLL